ncbi:hypothetical protein [Phenylobacterium deserti]|uniref:RecT family protein n=1 Tax=Phenylobacterium deserti TaxID=1914756 RepID=A0A328ABW3_9CAUL|nr:hypothetical protein [Phenylobacterium deserti]RAK52099.1 hypothetical protein DJ018_13165 [Phenylobacterium deserti]
MNALTTTTATYAVSDLERMAKAFAASQLFGVKNADQALALCLVAQAEGRHPATAAQDYSIIQNRPSKKADAMLRDFLASGGKVEWHELSDAKADATFSHPAGGSARIDWTLDRAKKAGLSNNAMYTKYPRQMLRARTVSEGVRTVCPGATSGMYVPEEVHDIVQEQPQRAAPQQQEPAQDAEFSEAPALEFAPIVERKKAAQAKRDGDDEQIRKELNSLDITRLTEWEAEFDQRTAHLPLSWLDAIRDMIHSRREELLGAAAVAEEEAGLDEAFRASLGEAGASLISGRELADRQASKAA